MRKLLHPLIAIALLGLVSCSSQSSDISESAGTKQFRITNNKQYAENRVIATDLDHLALLVYKDGSLFKNFSQTDPNFTLTLGEGSYDAVFLGYYKNYALTCGQGPQALSFEGGYVPNTFWTHRTLNITESGDESESITLKHVCAAFSLMCSDYAEMTDLASMCVTIRGGYNVLDGTTGYASAQASDRVSTYTVTSSVFEAGNRLTVYTYLPADSANLDITVDALDASGNTIKSRTFEQVPLRLSHKSIYTGNFLSDSEDPTPSEEEIKVNYSWTLELEDADWTDVDYTF